MNELALVPDVPVAPGVAVDAVDRSRQPSIVTFELLVGDVESRWAVLDGLAPGAVCPAAGVCAVTWAIPTALHTQTPTTPINVLIFMHPP
jgi:hypothetical protein